MFRILFNPHASNGKGFEAAKKIRELLPDEELDFLDITETDYAPFFASLSPEDKVVLCGGDGTLNRFANETKDIDFPCEILYYPCGTGNDFFNDIREKEGPLPSLNKYLKDLPRVTVNGKTCLFLNNVGFGIDGYCTEEGDRLQKLSDKPVNYTSIAIKGLLGKFKPANATVTIDGVTRSFKKAWLAPTMNGRFYGGGMMPAPAQDRLNPDHSVSVFVWYGSGKLKTLMAFPSIFKGEHVKHTDMCLVFTGHDVTVEFDRPCPLQIDGETVSGVTSYHVETV
jgi:diacylglycerol kinase family enzyme